MSGSHATVVRALGKETSVVQAKAKFVSLAPLPS